MPDPFSTLPLPLPLIILKSIEDLSTLNYLLKASPSANAIFTRYCCAVIESIISNFVPGLQRLSRIIVSIRSQPARIRAECVSIEAFKAFRDSHIRGKYIWNNNVGSDPLQESTASLSAFRSLVNTASQVQDLSAAFFVEFIGRINNIKPYCSVGGNVSATDPKVRVPDPRLCRYEIVPVSEPSWIEEQRVLRGLWSVVVWLDLKDIMRPEEGCQDEVWEMLVQDGPQCIWSPNDWYPEGCHEWRDAWRLQETECILDYLCQLYPGSNPSAPKSTNLRTLPEVEPMLFRTPKRLPSPDTYSGHLRSFDCEANRLWQSPSFLEMPSPGHYWFFSPKPLADPLLFDYVDFKPWQALGLGIWDQEKLARLGLAEFNTESYLIPELYLVGPHKELPSKMELVIRWKNLHGTE